MKISMIAVGGIDEIAPLACALGAQGHEVTVHTRREQPGKRRSCLADGVTVDPIPAGPERPLDGAEAYPYLAEFGRRLAERWVKGCPDVVHAHGWTGGLAAMTAAKALEARGRAVPGKLRILQSYDHLSVDPELKVAPEALARLERALGRAAEATTVGCEQDREFLVRLGVPRKNIAVVPTGVDVEEFTEKGPAAPRGTRSRLLTLDGPIPAAAEAIRALPRIPDAELVIAGGPLQADLGTDPEVEALRIVAKDEGVEDRVIFLGRVARKRVPRLIRSADLVLALDAERVAVEAMACGVPVIAPRSGPHLDTVLDEVTGVLVPRLSPPDLARRIRSLLNDPIRREALGIAAADRVRSRHSWERIARETAQVYTRISWVRKTAV